MRFKFTLVLLLISLAGFCQKMEHNTRLLIQEQARHLRHKRHPVTNHASLAFEETIFDRRGRQYLMDSFKYSFVFDRATYSLCSGYRDPSGGIGVKFEDRFLRVNNFQPGIAFGFSVITGFRFSVGTNYFFVSEKNNLLPFINGGFIFTSGNKLTTYHPDVYYCITGKENYASIAAGVKYKPWAKNHYNIDEERPLKSLICFKLSAGYAFNMSNPSIDTNLHVKTPNGEFGYNQIRDAENGGFFIELNLGIDIPFIKASDEKQGLVRSLLNKSR